MESAVIEQAVAVTVGPELLALVAFVGVMALNVLGAWLILRTLMLPYAEAFAPYEQLLVLRLENVGSSAVLLVLRVPVGTLEALESIYNAITKNLTTLIVVVVLALGALAFTEYQPTLTGAYLRARQCFVAPFAEDTVLRLANFVRLLYDAAYAFVNVGAEMLWTATKGAWHVLRACASFEAVGDVLVAVGNALEALATAVGNFLANGGLFDERLALAAALYALGLGANAVLAPLNCLCAALEPIWEFVVALPQLTSLHTTIDCAANVPVRTFQALFAAVANWTAVDWSNVAVELTCVDVAAGLVAEEVSVLGTTLLGDLLDLINITEASLGLESAGMAKPTLSELMHAAAGTTASPLGQLGAAAGTTPFWQMPPGGNLSDLLGLPLLLRLVSTPWSSVVTQPVAAAIALGNLTLNAVSASATIFETPDGIAYFQVKGIFDRLRTAADVAAQVLLGVLFTDATACAASMYAQAVLTYIEGAFELFFVVLYSAIFPMWLPGGQSLANCSVPGTCTIDNAPDGWTVFRAFPAYYRWPGNALNRTLTMLLDNATCLGELFGCNTTAEPDCKPDYPFQCAVMSTHRLAVDVVNLTNAFLLLVPDLVRFNATAYGSFLDLAPALLFQRMEELVDCIVGTHATLPFLFFFFLTTQRATRAF